MNTERSDSGADMASLIDRLVCGEIDEAARGRLIEWLEAEPTRWRLCGLAFLEAQVWSQTLSTWSGAGDEQLACNTSEDLVPVTSRLRVEPPSRDREQPVRVARVGYSTALAASVLVAFGLGVLSRGAFVAPESNLASIEAGTRDTKVSPQLPHKPAAATKHAEQPPAPGEPVLASFTARAGYGLAEATFQFPIVQASDSAAETDDGPPAVPDYVRQQWERRGFAVQTQRRYVFGKLPTGERVAVPVDNVEFNPIPIEVH